MKGVVLDTCAALWLTGGSKMTAPALAAIDEAAQNRVLWLSPITAWEVAAKISAGKPGAPTLSVSAQDWYAGLLSLPGLREAPLVGSIAVKSAVLPWLHRDPADRFLMATAIELEATIVTRDSQILAYAEAGLIDALAC